jgi:hypothetical protein
MLERTITKENRDGVYSCKTHSGLLLLLLLCPVPNAPRRSLILRHARRRRPVFVLTTSVSWVPTCGTTHHITLLLGRCSSTTDHLLHVRAVLDVLEEVADVATNLLVGLEAKGNDGDEAEGEPFPALHYATAVV